LHLVRTLIDHALNRLLNKCANTIINIYTAISEFDLNAMIESTRVHAKVDSGVTERTN
jgi:hypothetical protein